MNILRTVLSDNNSQAILAVIKHVPGNQVPGKCPEPPVKQGMEPRELGSNQRISCPKVTI